MFGYTEVDWQKADDWYMDAKDNGYRLQDIKKRNNFMEEPVDQLDSIEDRNYKIRGPFASELRLWDELYVGYCAAPDTSAEQAAQYATIAINVRAQHLSEVKR